jgi:hypothetical protein
MHAILKHSELYNVMLQGETGFVATWLEAHSVKLEGYRFQAK